MTLRGALTALLIPALLASGGAARAAAQGTTWRANVNASVKVAPPPVLLETTRDLYFGSVGPGSDVAVPARPPYTAGTWSAGVRFSNLRKTVKYGIRLTLPANLTNGTTNLPVSWNGVEYGWMCVWNATTSTPATCDVQQVAYNPASHTAAGSELMVDLPNNTPQNNVFSADVYVGGRLTVPGGSLAPGLYSAPLTVTISVLN
ncbi:MAG: hypothetical protein KY467_04110 [Gemmatimonadetes bacterium]|nr:hypothetical protein [Gemmatimonadota bacterium]